MTARAKPPAGDDKKALVELRQQFRDAGVTVADWAKAKGFERQAVIDVLHGRRRGLRGEAHRVALALGLKAGRVVDPAAFHPKAKA